MRFRECFGFAVEKVFELALEKGILRIWLRREILSLRFRKHFGFVIEIVFELAVEKGFLRLWLRRGFELEI